MAVFVLAVHSLGLAGFAQTSAATTPEPRETSWENLRQLRAGQKVQVVQKDLKFWTGLFLSFSDDSVALKLPDGDKVVVRAEVLRVSRHGGKRGRNALIGAAAAGGAGVAAGVATGGCPKGGLAGFCVGKGTLGAVLGAAGAAIGGGIGAAIPGNTVVYRAPAK